MFRRWAFAVLVTATTLTTARSLQAQGATATFRISLSPDSTAMGVRFPIVRADSILADDRWLSALRSGLPIRLRYRVELWRTRGGWFDAFSRQTEWDVVVRHEPLLDQYTLLTLSGRQRQERRYATIDALGAALGFAYRVNIPPSEVGRYYYAAQLTITTLSDSDLDELERFLKGDLGDVAGGRESFGDAVGRGATRFLLRLAGLPSVRLEARTDGFTVRTDAP